MDGEATTTTTKSTSTTQVKEELRKRRRLAAQLRRSTMTPEEREIHLASRRQRRVPETEDKKEQRRMRDRLRRERQSRERLMDCDGNNGRITQINEEQKERRRLARQIRYRNMSAEEKEKLLARRRQRRRPETEQQKEQRKLRERLRRERQSKTNRHVSMMREPGESNGETDDNSSSRRGVRLTKLRRQARAATEPDQLAIDFAEESLAIGIPDTHFNDIHFLADDFFSCENALEMIKAEQNFSEDITFESQGANYTLEAIDEHAWSCCIEKSEAMMDM